MFVGTAGRGGRKFALLGIATTAMLAVGPMAGPALAAGSGCGSSRACLWEDSNFSGDPWFEESGFTTYNSGWWHNDDASSTWNRIRKGYLYLYDDTNHSPKHGTACVPQGYADKKMGDHGWGDRVSSMRISSAVCDPEAVTVLWYYKGF